MDVGLIALPARCLLPNSRIDPSGLLNGMGILNSVMYYLISITSMYDAPYRLIPSLSGGVDLCHYFCVIFMENFFFF